MSSPTARSEETRSQDSVHGSSQFAADAALEDTASSVRQGGRLPGSSSPTTSRAPNAAYSRGVAAARARSVSPGPRRPPSPLGLSVAQRRARLAEQSAATAISSVGRVEAETCRVRELVEATSAEAKSVRGEVESRVATLAAAADASAMRAVTEIAGQVEKVAAYSDAQASRVAAEVTQRLEQEIGAAASSTAATAEITIRTAVEGVRRDIQAQMDQNRADALRREDEAQKRVQKISNQLKTLTEQLNQFKPTSEHAVGVSQEKLSDQVQQRFDAQEHRITKLSDTVFESQKVAQTNAETLHSLLVSIENLGENVKNMQEEMVAWQSGFQDAEREYQNMNE